MKNLISAAALAVAAFIWNPQNVLADPALENDPGYLNIDRAIDIKAVHPQVNVNLPRFMLKDAAASLNGGPDDPFKGTDIKLADLIKDVKLIRVVVFEARKTDRDVLEKGMKDLRAQLDAKWTALVSVADGKENVGVYVRSSDDGESMAGLALLVHDGSDAVVANIVGKVSIGQVVKAASRMHKFPKDLLKKLGAAGQPAEETPEQPQKNEPAPKAE
jgi:hypothetical protein